LKAECEKMLSKLDQEPEVRALDPQLLAGLLKMALKNEMEAAEIAAQWVADTPELGAKLALVRHAGDEARHYQLLEQEVRTRGVDLAGFDPLHPPSPVLEYLRTLQSSAERVAAALVAREAMGGRRNAQFVKLLEAAGQADLARLYREVINPDEDRHHRAGCEVLAGLATGDEAQQRARHAALLLLEIGDRARDAALAKTGAACVPGC
ncbi:MAG: ferritin-like domain-containing protein, partial [Terriglobales bacterium]